MAYVSYESIYVKDMLWHFDWSHWGELNPRPSPYQGDAIPLSHSGSETTTEVVGLIVATMKKGFFKRHCENLLSGGADQPRSHSPVLRGPGKPVGFFPREFKSRPRRQNMHN